MTSKRCICEWCGDEFDRASHRGPSPRYCSGSHRQQAYQARRAIRLAASPELQEQLQKITAPRLSPELQEQLQKIARHFRELVTSTISPELREQFQKIAASTVSPELQKQFQKIATATGGPDLQARVRLFQELAASTISPEVQNEVFALARTAVTPDLLSSVTLLVDSLEPELQEQLDNTATLLSAEDAPESRYDDGAARMAALTGFVLLLFIVRSDAATYVPSAISEGWALTLATLVQLSEAEQGSEAFHGLVVLAGLLGIPAFIIAVVQMLKK